MRTTRLAALALAAPTGAQSPYTTGSTVTYAVGFVDIGGNSNGVLEPGESALVQISVAFSNQNATAAYTPGSPPPGSGTIRGFGSGFIDLNGTANNGGDANGAWNVDFISTGNGPVAEPWYSPLPGWGTPASGGSRLININFGQFPVNPAAVITTNPINLMYQALWTPAAFTPRTVTFAAAPALPSGGFASSLIFQISATNLTSINCPSSFDSVSIPIIPTPASVLPLALAVFTRRARPCPETPP